MHKLMIIVILVKNVCCRLIMVIDGRHWPIIGRSIQFCSVCLRKSRLSPFMLRICIAFSMNCGSRTFRLLKIHRF